MHDYLLEAAKKARMKHLKSQASKYWADFYLDFFSLFSQITKRINEKLLKDINNGQTSHLFFASINNCLK